MRSRCRACSRRRWSYPTLVASSSRFRTLASGATITRAPATCARQHRLTSSRKSLIPSSNPPISANRSARTRVHGAGTVKTSRTASCCDWSSSPRSTSGTP